VESGPAIRALRQIRAKRHPQITQITQIYGVNLGDLSGGKQTHRRKKWNLLFHDAQSLGAVPIAGHDQEH
jgi:hypothetical protein